MPGVDELVHVSKRPLADYVAEAHATIPLDSPYALVRGADKGLVTLHCFGEDGERDVRSFRIPRQEIETVVTVRYDTTPLDRTEVIFERDATYVVHTSDANAGIFTASDVWELPRLTTTDEYRSVVARRGASCTPETPAVLRAIAAAHAS